MDVHTLERVSLSLYSPTPPAFSTQITSSAILSIHRRPGILKAKPLGQFGSDRPSRMKPAFWNSVRSTTSLDSILCRKSQRSNSVYGQSSRSPSANDMNSERLAPIPASLGSPDGEARERVVQALCIHFASDHLTMH